MKNINIIFRTSLLLIFSLIFVGCNEDLVYDKEVVKAPVITDFSPKSGVAGTKITITGEHLQKVDSVWIGGGVSEVTRISTTQSVVTIGAESKTGVIRLKGTTGEAQTTEAFTVQYTVPTLTKFDAKIKPNEQMFIEGTDMDAVVSILFGTTEGTIISRTNTDMIVQVPFFPEDKVDIYLAYNTADGLEQWGTTGKPFSLDVESATVTDAPSKAENAGQVTLKGTNLLLVTKALFGDKEGTILLKENELIVVEVPAGYTTATNVEFALIYGDAKKLVVNSNFRIFIVDAPNVHYWGYKTIYAQSQETPNNFFDALNGNIYSPCDYATKKNDISFFITISASSIQLNNPNNSENQTRNFKCNGVALPTEKMPNIVKFKVLNPDNANEKEYIDAVKERTLQDITPQDIVDAGIPNAVTNGPRFYGEGLGTNQMKQGDVLLVQQFNASGTVLKVGFIEIIRFTTTNPAADQKSAMTFCCYFQK